MTTRTFVFIGDTLEVNADAKGGAIIVDASNRVIKGFSKAGSIAITGDSFRHMLKWKDEGDCHLIQARPIRLRFHMNKVRLYSLYATGPPQAPRSIV